MPASLNLLLGASILTTYHGFHTGRKPTLRVPAIRHKWHRVPRAPRHSPLSSATVPLPAPIRTRRQDQSGVRYWATNPGSQSAAPHRTALMFGHQLTNAGRNVVISNSASPTRYMYALHNRPWLLAAIAGLAAVQRGRAHRNRGVLG